MNFFSKTVDNVIAVGSPVKFIGGKYNGLVGNVMKLCDTECSVRIEFERKMHEVVESIKFLRKLRTDEL